MKEPKADSPKAATKAKESAATACSAGSASGRSWGALDRDPEQQSSKMSSEVTTAGTPWKKAAGLMGQLLLGDKVHLHCQRHTSVTPPTISGPHQESSFQASNSY